MRRCENEVIDAGTPDWLEAKPQSGKPDIRPAILAPSISSVAVRKYYSLFFRLAKGRDISVTHCTMPAPDESSKKKCKLIVRQEVFLWKKKKCWRKVASV